MCRRLRVSTSGFYAWIRRPKSRRTRGNERLLERIRAHHEASDGVLGMPRINEAYTRREKRRTAIVSRVSRPGQGCVGFPSASS